MWTISRRTGFESALIRADRDLARATEHADAAGDEGLVDDLVSMRHTLIALVRASHQETRRKLPRPIPGQIQLETGPGESKPYAASGASLEPTAQRSDRRRK
jgi:hypothetical protein